MVLVDGQLLVLLVRPIEVTAVKPHGMGGDIVRLHPFTCVTIEFDDALGYLRENGVQIGMQLPWTHD